MQNKITTIEQWNEDYAYFSKLVKSTSVILCSDIPVIETETHAEMIGVSVKLILKLQLERIWILILYKYLNDCNKN